MPGVHGGGTPANAFSKLTDFYYLRRAQNRLHGDQPEAVGYWAHFDLKHLALRSQRLISLVAFGSALLTRLLLYRRRKHILQVHSRQAFNGDNDPNRNRRRSLTPCILQLKTTQFRLADRALDRLAIKVGECLMIQEVKVWSHIPWRVDQIIGAAHHVTPKRSASSSIAASSRRCCGRLRKKSA